MSVVANVGYYPSVPIIETQRVQASKQQQSEQRLTESVQVSNEPKPSEPQVTQAKPIPVVQTTASDLQLVFDKKLQFVVDDTHQVIVKVIDRETDKVIKELPPEELQRLHANLRETIGFLFDERV